VIRKSRNLALLAASLVLAACGEAGSSSSAATSHPSARFLALSIEEQNLAVYDAVAAQLDKNYFDPNFLKTPEWQARIAESRQKVAGLKDGLSLYNQVIFPLTQNFPQSHVSVIPPAKTGSTTKSPDASADLERMNALGRSGPGFDYVTLRRGMKFNFAVGDVIKGSLADREGISPGWAIDSLSINREESAYKLKAVFMRLSAEEARAYERAFSWTPEGVKTREEADAYLKTLRAEAAYDIELLPQRAPFETRLIGEVTYLRFDNFEDAALIKDVLGVIDKAGPKGLIVDLRHNSGGLLTNTEHVLTRLIGNDAYIGTNRKGWLVRNWRTPKKGPAYSGPLAVLIGPSSCSAAEITAAAVQDNRRGPLLGRMSNGSVLNSQMYPLPDGGLMQVPILDFVRGGDRRIEGVGVEPDIWILPTLEDVRAGRDPVLERALEEIS
jgi:carboxyl-terminal processing protease